MNKSLSIQLHTLTSYPASLLNRDDVGFAKRIPFGGETRTRVSSQCLKRHWRTFEGDHSFDSLSVPSTVRSRRTFEEYIVKPLIEDGVDVTLARAVTSELMSIVLGKSEKAEQKGQKAEGKAKSEPKAEELRTEQVTVLGRPEIEFLLEQARAVCAQAPKDPKEAVQKRFDRAAKDNLSTLKHGSGLSAALFGRMITSDVLARGDAALHVAHAFTVHKENTESDYFSAIDDLQRADGELGSGHINSSELSTGLYYGYVVVDVPLLVSNLEGCDRKAWREAPRELAAGVVQRLVHLIATVSPGAKLGSTAPYAFAHSVIAEVSSGQPRSFANAFLKPVAQRPDVLANTYQALATHAGELDRVYGAPRRFGVALGPAEHLHGLWNAESASGTQASLQELANWVAREVLEPRTGS
jgi:CRISPR system Cascade subunit CasC